MIQDETEQTVEDSEIYLLVDLGQDGLHHDVTLALAGLSDVCQVDEVRRRLSVRGLDPRREQATLVSLEEQKLIKILQCGS